MTHRLTVVPANAVSKVGGIKADHQPINFIDLKAQQARLRPQIEKRLSVILDHGRYIAGPEIEALEEQLAEWTGARGAVACASGTDALVAPLLARGLVTGDAVFVPAFTYNATANSVLLTGAAPVFVDIDPKTYTMCPRALQAAIDGIKAEGRLQPRAVIPVDLFGLPADYDAITDIAAREDLYVLADGAQSFGGQYGADRVGNIAPNTAVSFFPGKALGAYGDAGAMFTQDEADIEAFTSIRWHGTDAHRKESVRVGFNGRMDSFQAAILLEKLSIFDDELAARRHIAAIYDRRLKGCVDLQQTGSKAVSGYGYYSVTTPHRDAVVERLKAAGVPTAIYYNTPLHQMPAFSAYAPRDGLPALTQTAALSKTIFSLPMHPYLTEAQVVYICDAVESAVSASIEIHGADASGEASPA
ncbi:MAG: DegT/DnrJ/EryC1/StrS family aminotransferase [Pseudomonadota bacterium]